MQLAVKHGLPAIALADTGSLHGAPEFAGLAAEAGIKPLIGAELTVGRHRVPGLPAGPATISGLLNLKVFADSGMVHG